MRKNRRRLKFEQWLLLATRCLLVLLLGLALARPLGCENGALAQFGRHTSLDIFVIDNSYSAAYEANRPDAKTHLDQAKKVVQALLNRASTGGESVIVITAGKPARAIISTPQHDMVAARLALSRIEQMHGSTDLAGALQLALKAAAENSTQPNKNLYLLTDGTRSAWEGSQAKALQQLGPELAGAFSKISHFNLSGGQSQWNAAVLDISPVDNLVTTSFKSEFKANLKVYGAGHDGTLQWKLDDQPLDTPAAGSTLDAGSPMTEIGFETGGTHVLTARLVNDDRLALDNLRYRVVDVVSKLKVLIVQDRGGIGPLGGSGAFLATALAPRKPTEPGKPEQSDSPFEPEVITDLELDHKVLGDYSAVILAGVGELTPAKAASLRLYAEAGGALVLFMGDAVGKDNYNASGLLPGRLVERKDMGSGDNAFHFDFDPNKPLHPFLNLFANQPGTGLDVARIFKYWQLELDPAAGAERILNYLPDPDARSSVARAVRDMQGEQSRIAGEFVALHDGKTDAGAQATADQKLAADQALLAKRMDGIAEQLRAARTLPLDNRKRQALEDAIKAAAESGGSLRSLSEAIKANQGGVQEAAGQANDGLKRIIDKLLEAGGKLDLGDPAITTQSLGKGKVLFFSTSADNQWTSIDAKPNYVPLVHELLRNVVRSRDWWMNLSVGDALEIPPTLRLSRAPVLMDPNGGPVLIDPEPRGLEVVYRTAPIEKPGVYTLTLGNDKLPIAVNVPAAEEADITTLKDEAITKALGDIKMTMFSSDLPAEASATREDNDFSWWTMMAVLGLVGFECFIAMKFGHHRQVEAGRNEASSVRPMGALQT